MCWMIDSCWIKDFVCYSIPVEWGLAWKNLARKVALVAATCELAAKLQNNTRRRSPNISNWQIVQKYLASNCEGIFFTSINCETQRFTDEVSKYFSPGAKYWSNTVCTWFWIIFKTPILLIETPDITFQGDFWNLQINADHPVRSQIRKYINSLWKYNKYASNTVTLVALFDFSPLCVFKCLMKLRQMWHSYIGCTCSTFPHCVFSNASSNCLPERMQSHIGCICLAFLHYVFSNVDPLLLSNFWEGENLIFVPLLASGNWRLQIQTEWTGFLEKWKWILYPCLLFAILG